MPHYGDKKYWEEHYKKNEGETFYWLEEYPTLKKTIDSLKIPKNSGKILNVGCGNSELSENMYDNGYLNIYNIDISQKVINLMTERSKNRPGIIYKVMDVCDIKYENNFFDLIIDKSTMDALSCGYYYYINIAKMLKEIQRVLKVGGYYMMVSYEEPESRMIHLNRKFLKFKIDILKIEQKGEKGKDNYNYIYLCQKLEGADEDSEKFFDEIINELIQEEEMEEDDQDECQEKIKNKENKNINININDDYDKFIQEIKNSNKIIRFELNNDKKD